MTAIVRRALISLPEDPRRVSSERDRARQLPLGFEHEDVYAFDTFMPGANAGVVSRLQDTALGRSHDNIYLWGEQGAGKSHLLLAACRAARQAERPCAYLPLSQLDDFTPALFSALENLSLVCLDDVEMVAGRHDWETALFDLFNRLRDAGAPLVMGAAHGPDGSPVRLPDLRSRLSWDLAFRLQAPDESMKIELLERRARERGLLLGREVTDYLMRRVNRDIPNLLRWLDRLDTHSLATQKRLTVPLVRQLLEQADP